MKLERFHIDLLLRLVFKKKVLKKNYAVSLTKAHIAKPAIPRVVLVD